MRLDEYATHPPQLQQHTQYTTHKTHNIKMKARKKNSIKFTSNLYFVKRKNKTYTETQQMRADK